MCLGIGQFDLWILECVMMIAYYSTIIINDFGSLSFTVLLNYAQEEQATNF